MVLVSLGLKASPLAVGFGAGRKDAWNREKGAREKRGPKTSTRKNFFSLPPSPSLTPKLRVICGGPCLQVQVAATAVDGL